MTNLYQVNLDWNSFRGTIPQFFTNMRTDASSYQWYTLSLHHNYFTGVVSTMPFWYGRFMYTFDQNCQLTAPFATKLLGPQTNCPPGTAGQAAPTAFPTAAPTQGTLVVVCSCPSLSSNPPLPSLEHLPESLLALSYPSFPILF
jgi:hypothetical protein